MNWSVEDVQKEFTVLETIAKMWLETKGIPDHKKHMFILQQLGKECLCHWESFSQAIPLTTKRNMLTTYRKPLKAHSGKIQAPEATESRL